MVCPYLTDDKNMDIFILMMTYHLTFKFLKNHWSLSLSFHFSPRYSFLAQMGTGDISGVLSKQMWLSGIPKFQSPLLVGIPLKTVYKRPTMHLPFYLACYGLGRDSHFTTNTALPTRPTALFFYGAQEITGVLSWVSDKGVEFENLLQDCM